MKPKSKKHLTTIMVGLNCGNPTIGVWDL